MEKIKYGLKNTHYAVVTEDNAGNITYGTPKAIPGAVNLTLTSNAEKTDIAADDISDYATVYDNRGYEGELEIQILPDEFRTEVLGEELDANGVQIEGVAAQPKRIALMFEFSSDARKVRHVLYSCTVSKPDIESSTKGESIENKTDKLTFTAGQAKDTGYIKAKAYSDNPKYDTWFDEVYLSAGSPAVLVTPSEIIFDKKTANQKDLTFNLMLGTSQTLTSVKNGVTTLTSTTNYTNTSGVLTIKSAYASTLPVGVTQLLLTFSNSMTRTITIRVIDTTA